MTHLPTSEQVAVDFLRSLTALRSNVATTLPTTRGDVFYDKGFVTVLVLDDVLGVDSETHHAVLQVDTWAGRPGPAGGDGSQPDFGKADQTSAVLQRTAFKASKDLHRVVTRAGYHDARVDAFTIETGPNRIPDDGGLARYRHTARLAWVSLE